MIARPETATGLRENAALPGEQHDIHVHLDPEAQAEREAIQAERADEQVAFSWGRDSRDAYPKQCVVESFAAFAKFICDRRAEQKGLAWFAAPFAPDEGGKHHRAKDTAAARRYLPLDLDYIADGETLAALMLALQPWCHFAYTTASSTAAAPRLRVVVELSRPVNRDEGIRCGLACQRDLMTAAGIAANAVTFDESVYRAEQPCFGLVTNSEVYPRNRRMSGAPLDTDELLANAPEIAPTVTAAARADAIAHDDPLVHHLAAHGYVLDVPTPAGKLAIRCPNDAAHSEVTSPTSCVVLLPHFNGVAQAVINCKHDSCAKLTQAEFRSLAGYVEPDDVRRPSAKKLVRHDDPNEATGGQTWPEPLDLRAMALRQPQPPRFILADWLPVGYATLLAGHGGVGKSAIGLHLLVCIAMGLPFFGITTERRRVLYLSCEDRENLLHWRLAHICNYLGISIDALAGWLDILDLVGHDTVLWQADPRTGYTFTRAFAELADGVKRQAAQVLAVDGVSDTFGGSENARPDVKRYVNVLLSLVPADDGALLLLGHVAKPTAANADTAEGYSGSTQWHNAVRARWYLYPETEDSDDQNSRRERTGKLLLELQKANLGPVDRSLTFEWDDEKKLFLAPNAAVGVVGVVATIERGNDRKWILRKLAHAEDTGTAVFSSERANRNAHAALSAYDDFPQAFRNRRGRKALFKLLLKLLTEGLLGEKPTKTASRNHVTVWTVTPKGREEMC